MKVTSKNQYNRLKIYINSIIHISIPKTEDIKIQSWYEDDSLYKIEIYCNGHLDEHHYNNFKLWKEVLTHLDKLV